MFFPWSWICHDLVGVLICTCRTHWPGAVFGFITHRLHLDTVLTQSCRAHSYEMLEWCWRSLVVSEFKLKPQGIISTLKASAQVVSPQVLKFHNPPEAVFIMFLRIFLPIFMTHILLLHVNAQCYSSQWNSLENITLTFHLSLYLSLSLIYSF